MYSFVYFSPLYFQSFFSSPKQVNIIITISFFDFSSLHRISFNNFSFMSFTVVVVVVVRSFEFKKLLDDGVTISNIISLIIPIKKLLEWVRYGEAALSLKVVIHSIYNFRLNSLICLFFFINLHAY